MSTNEAKNDESIEDDGSWITVPKKKKRYIGVVTEDHPVVKKILEFIEKIQTIENETVRHDEFQDYLGSLPINELVLYCVYKQINTVPAIYKYDGSIGLSVDEILELLNILRYEYVDLDT
jgi:hypothetical protein